MRPCRKRIVFSWVIPSLRPDGRLTRHPIVLPNLCWRYPRAEEPSEQPLPVPEGTEHVLAHTGEPHPAAGSHPNAGGMGMPGVPAVLPQPQQAVSVPAGTTGTVLLSITRWEPHLPLPCFIVAVVWAPLTWLQAAADKPKDLTALPLAPYLILRFGCWGFFDSYLNCLK